MKPDLLQPATLMRVTDDETAAIYESAELRAYSGGTCSRPWRLLSAECTVWSRSLFPDSSWSGTDVAAPAGPDAGELADGGTPTGRSRHAALFYQGPGAYLPALSRV